MGRSGSTWAPKPFFRASIGPYRPPKLDDVGVPRCFPSPEATSPGREGVCAVGPRPQRSNRLGGSLRQGSSPSMDRAEPQVLVRGRCFSSFLLSSVPFFFPAAVERPPSDTVMLSVVGGGGWGAIEEFRCRRPGLARLTCGRFWPWPHFWRSTRPFCPRRPPVNIPFGVFFWRRENLLGVRRGQPLVHEPPFWRCGANLAPGRRTPHYLAGRDLSGINCG